MAFVASGGLFLAAALVTRLTIDRQEHHEEPRQSAEPEWAA